MSIETCQYNYALILNEFFILIGEFFHTFPNMSPVASKLVIDFFVSYFPFS